MRPRFRPLAIAFSFLVAALALSLGSYGGQSRFRQANQEYQTRRARLRASVDGPVVIFGYTGHEDASEVAVFFQEPSFYYLTGHDQAGAALLLIPDPTGISSGEPPGPREILYVHERDLARERWEGPKLGPSDPGVAEKAGFQAIEPFDNLRNDLLNLAKTYSSFYTLVAPPEEEGYPHLTNGNNWLRGVLPQAKLVDIGPALFAMRQVKSPGELTLMQKAIDLSIDAQLDAMRTLRPGMFEYEVAARMEKIHAFGGCAREAYAPIVGAGFNSTVLHYSALDSQIKDGDVVVIDVGGEYGGYAADITRTLPANGKFTPRQREIYDIVLAAQNAAIAAIKPGAILYDGPGSLQHIAFDYINSHGHDGEGRPLGRYFIHGVSHHLGLDVHDPGDRKRPLEPGMVVTVEPGIYIPEENLGVRIEDDILVTAEGRQILTDRLPRSANEVERIMSGGRHSRAESSP